MKRKLDISHFIESGIQNELDYERALILNRKLRTLSKTDTKYKKSRSQLLELIEQYEQKNWVGKSISENKINQSDLAETIAESERSFIKKRKELIRTKLKEYDLTQQQLGELLGHTSKSYMSELMNGVSAFTLNDLVVIHRLLNIKLKELIPTIIGMKRRNSVIRKAKSLNNPKLDVENSFKDETLSTV